ncbi:MAG: energy transducer TonB, partial [bacterium]
ILFSNSKPLERTGLDLQEVSFMDVTYRPEVAKVVSSPPATPHVVGGEVSNGLTPSYGGDVAADDVAPLDMTATLERSNSQAKIELERYELTRGGEMDVIRIGGKGSSQTTEEILAQAPISLARREGGTGSGSGSGLRGVPGVPQIQPQLTIEHRPLAKPSAEPKLPQLTPQSQPSIQSPVTRGTSFQIAGPISEREVVNKVKPKYPKWALEQRISGTVTVRIWVMPNGKVKGMPQVISSSGYPDLDQVVVNAVREWEFAPLAPGVKFEEQWGDVTFIFQLS